MRDEKTAEAGDSAEDRRDGVSIAVEESHDLLDAIFVHHERYVLFKLLC